MLTTTLFRDETDTLAACACPECACRELTSLGVCPACRVTLHAEPAVGDSAGSP